MLRWILAEGRQGDRSAILWQAHRDLPSLPGDSAGTTTLILPVPRAFTFLMPQECFGEKRRQCFPHSFISGVWVFSGKLLTPNLGTESVGEDGLLFLRLSGRMPEGRLGLEFELVHTCRKVGAARI